MLCHEILTSGASFGATDLTAGVVIAAPDTDTWLEVSYQVHKTVLRVLVPSASRQRQQRRFLGLLSPILLDFAQFLRKAELFIHRYLLVSIFATIPYILAKPHILRLVLDPVFPLCLSPLLLTHILNWNRFGLLLQSHLSLHLR